jgi:hypothetical protein
MNEIVLPAQSRAIVIREVSSTWVRLFSQPPPEGLALGAENPAYIAERLLAVLSGSTHDGRKELEWVLSLSEDHWSLYASHLADGRLRLSWQDAHAVWDAAGSFELTDADRAGWAAALRRLIVATTPVPEI